ncbi:MAG: DUF1697 domain-containing protein [Pseudomonadota bacterium]
MTTWIALLRGINVGGKNIVPMKTLRDLLTGLGCENVRTYIQSGNCVFQSRHRNADAVARDTARAIDTEFGFSPPVFCLSQTNLERALAENPYREAAAADPKSVHFYFLSEPAAEADLAGLTAIKDSSEDYALTDRVFYLLAPNGIGRSKVAARADAKLGVVTTARNYRTVLKLRELAR